MVQAIASHTLKDVSDRQAVEAFDRRILALSKAHEVLLQQKWTSARIEDVIALVLSLHGDAGRIEAAGPSLQIGPKATLSMALLLHELGTNAAKHGSLSKQSGRVNIVWKVEGGESGPELVLSWVETGGPRPVRPKQAGFGTRLIRMGLVGTNQHRKEYPPEGFRAEFRASLELMQAL